MSKFLYQWDERAWLSFANTNYADVPAFSSKWTSQCSITFLPGNNFAWIQGYLISNEDNNNDLCGVIPDEFGIGGSGYPVRIRKAGQNAVGFLGFSMGAFGVDGETFNTGDTVFMNVVIPVLILP